MRSNLPALAVRHSYTEWKGRVERCEKEIEDKFSGKEDSWRHDGKTKMTAEGELTVRPDGMIDFQRNWYGIWRK